MSFRRRRFTIGIFLLSLASPVAAAEQVPQWADQSVDEMTDLLVRGVGWFDDLFASDDAVAAKNAALFARWRHEMSYRQGAGGAYSTRFYLQADLPNLEHRAKLFIADDEQEFGSEPDEEDEPASPRAETPKEREVGIRYDLRARERSNLSFLVGAKVNPATPRFRLRYRRSWAPAGRWALRGDATASWDADEGLGGRLQIGPDYVLGDGRLLRWQNTLSSSEAAAEEHGVQWSSELRYFTRMTPDEALSWEAAAYGDTEPRPAVNGYRLRGHYRGRFLRPWLFLDILPEVEWPQWEQRRECSACFGIAVRLEVQFKRGGL